MPEPPPATTPPPAETPHAEDQTPPQTSIAKKPPARLITHKPRAKAAFAFKASEAGSGFQCKLDGGGFKPCAARVTFRLKPGRHVIQARATDPAGNTDPTPAKFVVKVVRSD